MQTSHRRFGFEEEDMEQELINKTSRLKQITLHLGNEIRDSNKFLNGLDSDFEKSKSFFDSTIGRVSKLAKSGSFKLYAYLILFSLFVFLTLYMLIRWFWTIMLPPPNEWCTALLFNKLFKSRKSYDRVIIIINIEIIYGCIIVNPNASNIFLCKFKSIISIYSTNKIS